MGQTGNETGETGSSKTKRPGQRNRGTKGTDEMKEPQAIPDPSQPEIEFVGPEVAGKRLKGGAK